MSQSAVLDRPTIHPIEQDSSVVPFEWDVNSFYKAIDCGAFDHPEELELIEGRLYRRMLPQDNDHIQATGYVHDALSESFGSTSHVRDHSPAPIGQASEPEPDVAVIRGSRREYDHRKPSPEDLNLVVEVSSSSIAHDRRVKASSYAKAGIPEYWIVNLNDQQLEVYRDPGELAGTEFGYGYDTILILGLDDTIVPLRTPGRAIKVRDLFPAVE